MSAGTPESAKSNGLATTMAALVGIHLLLVIEIVWNVFRASAGHWSRPPAEYDVSIAAMSIVALVAALFVRRPAIVAAGVLDLLLGLAWVVGFVGLIGQL